jgi:hypothetical protein
MNDTTPEMEARHRQILALRTPQERLEMAASMYETACALIRASLPPGLNAAQIKLALWERMHGHDPRCAWYRPRLQEEVRLASALCPTTSSASTVPNAASAAAMDN